MISIGVVARQTGVDVSTLRKWELRYGFPRPLRRPSGQRAYRDQDVATLQLISRRVAAGERIGQVMRELLAVAAGPPQATKFTPAVAQSPAVANAMALLAGNDLTTLRALLERTRDQESMLRFVEDFAAPLTVAVGEAWAAGQLTVHAEHFFSAMLESLLIRETDRFATSDASRVLLVNPSGEKHTLGLAMTHAVLAEAGVGCLRAFSDLPFAEIAAACAAHGAAAVGLSASVHYPPRILFAQIRKLRGALPTGVELWLGGGGMERLSALPSGVRTFSTFNEVIDAARSLRRPATSVQQER